MLLVTRETESVMWAVDMEVSSLSMKMAIQFSIPAPQSWKVRAKTAR